MDWIFALVLSLILLGVLYFPPLFLVKEGELDKKKENKKIEAFRVYKDEMLIAELLDSKNSHRIRNAAYRELSYRGLEKEAKDALDNASTN